MSPDQRQASFSQVSWPYSPGWGIMWNFQSTSPVRASTPMMSPGTFSMRVWS